MNLWLSQFQEPGTLTEESGVRAWFAEIASFLLNETILWVTGHPYRLVEIEFYYSGTQHPDPFTHCDPIQRQCCLWYFHKTGGVYRSGTYKGLDITFGNLSTFGGILIRTVERQGGTLINGPSCCVDHLLLQTGTSEVSELAQHLQSRNVWDQNSPLALTITSRQNNEVFTSPRVGLSLKQVKKIADRLCYILRPYRYLTEPRRIQKGKLYLVLSLHIQGMSQTTIHQLTGCPKHTIQQYIEAFEAGRLETDFSPYFGIHLKPKELCRLYGMWHTQYAIL